MSGRLPRSFRSARKVALRSICVALCLVVLVAAPCAAVRVPGESGIVGQSDTGGGEAASLAACPANAGCDAHARCVPGVRPGGATTEDTSGGRGYYCVCDEGWAGTGWECANVDECAAKRQRIRTHRTAPWESPCADRQVCTDTEGSFSCSCERGFAAGEDGGCGDVDECVEGTHNCLEDGLCDNTPGSFKCACKKGFNGDGVRACTDMCVPAAPAQRLDCFQDGNATQQLCEARGCCFDPQASSLPGAAAACYYPLPANALELTTLTRGPDGDHGVVECGVGHRAGDGTEGRHIGPFASDICPLALDVLMETETRVRVRVTDPALERWEVPAALFPPPPPAKDLQERALMPYQVRYTKSPFGFSVARRSTGELLFNSTPTTGRSSGLTFEEQYVSLTGIVPEGYWLYGLGEQNAPHRLPRGGVNADGSERADTYTLFAKDQPTPAHDPAGGSNLYGSHPLVVALSPADGAAFGVFMRSSSAMDVLLSRDSVAFRAVGGMLDLSFLLGPSLADVISQYTEVVGRPMVPPYWALGYHLCRWGYGSAAATAKVADTMRLAGVSQDAQWNDIDHMQMAHDFTLDPLTFRAGAMIAMIDSLHANNQRYVPIVDPAIASSPRGAYPPLDEALAKDVFIKDVAGAPVAGRVWPGGTYFPDFFHPAAGEYWAAQLRQFRTLLAFDGIWLDMNEPSNFCDGPCAALEKCENAGMDGDGEVSCQGGEEAAEAARKGRMFSPWKLRAKRGRRMEADRPPYLPGGRPLDEKTIAMSSQHCIADRWFAKPLGGAAKPSTKGLFGGLFGKRAKDKAGVPCKAASHYDVHNLYGLSETILTSEALVALTAERPFVITRSTFPGSGRFAGHWLGDNRATWTDMKESIPGMLTMGLLGIPLVGADVCGFAGATTRELCIRWTQLGAFYPFMRNHNDNVAPAQEPTAWDVEALGMMRSAIATRYRLLPYLYAAFHHAHKTGMPVARSLLLEFHLQTGGQDFPGGKRGGAYPDGEARGLLEALGGVEEQMMLGGALLVTPVLTEGARNVTGYFPPARWFALASGAELLPVPWGSGAEGSERGTVPGVVQLDAPLDVIPVHVRGGHVVPMQRPALTSAVSRTTPFTFLAAPDADGSAKGKAVLDDGVSLDTDSPSAASSLFLVLHSSDHGATGNFTLSASEGGYDPAKDPKVARDVTVEEIRVLGLDALSGEALEGTVNGEALVPEAMLFDDASKSLAILLWKQPAGVPPLGETKEDGDARRAAAALRGEPLLPSVLAPLFLTWAVRGA